MMQKQRPLTVALPKKGRLSAQFNGLLDAAGYNLDKKARAMILQQYTGTIRA